MSLTQDWLVWSRKAWCICGEFIVLVSQTRTLTLPNVCVQASAYLVSIPMTASSPVCCVHWEHISRKWDGPLASPAEVTWWPSASGPWPSRSVKPKVRKEPIPLVNSLFPSFWCVKSEHDPTNMRNLVGVGGCCSPVLSRTLLQHQHPPLHPLSDGHLPGGVWTELLRRLSRKHHHRLRRLHQHHAVQK